ncbi:MAG: PhzF family phenazine biosynthesis protein [Pseudomonadota bacterium]
MSDRPMQYPFQQVDVFTSVPFKGNPVAVVLDADGLTTAQMQSIASWTNLSETTFVCAPMHKDADYRLRIFTPRSELPFAGHPTLGSAWAALQRGLQPKRQGILIQECTKGLVALRRIDNGLFFALPEPNLTEVDMGQLSAVNQALGVASGAVLDSAIIDVGAVWLTIQLDSARRVAELDPDMPVLAAITPHITGVTVFGLHPEGEPAAVEVRSFAPALGAPEDPVCGSGNGCVAALIRQHGILDVHAYTASQGRRVGRDGRVEVEFSDDGPIWLGGRVVTCIDGVLSV